MGLIPRNPFFRAILIIFFSVFLLFAFILPVNYYVPTRLQDDILPEFYQDKVLIIYIFHHHAIMWFQIFVLAIIMVSIGFIRKRID